MSDFPGANQGARFSNATIYRKKLFKKLDELIRLLKATIRWLFIIAIILFFYLLFGLN